MQKNHNKSAILDIFSVSELVQELVSSNMLNKFEQAMKNFWSYHAHKDM